MIRVRIAQHKGSVRAHCRPRGTHHSIFLIGPSNQNSPTCSGATCCNVTEELLYLLELFLECRDQTSSAWSSSETRMRADLCSTPHRLMSQSRAHPPVTICNLSCNVSDTHINHLNQLPYTHLDGPCTRRAFVWDIDACAAWRLVTGINSVGYNAAVSRDAVFSHRYDQLSVRADSSQVNISKMNQTRIFKDYSHQIQDSNHGIRIGRPQSQGQLSQHRDSEALYE